MKKKVKSLQLPKVLRIRRGNCRRFSGAQHCQFQFNLYQLVKEADRQQLHLSDELLKMWADSIDLETEISKQAVATVQTDRMKELDRQRDDLLKNIFGVVRAQQKSPVEALRNAAKELGKAIAPYTGIQFKAVDAESAEVHSILKDLEHLAAEVTALGLAPVTTLLKDLNNEYQQTYAERQEKVLDLKQPSLHDVRPQTDAIFAVVCRHIEASYLFATTDKDRTTIERLADRMNQEADRFKATHKQRIAQKKKAAADKKSAAGPQTPEVKPEVKPEEPEA